MSLWLYDPTRSSRRMWNPLQEMAHLERSLDHFFDIPSQEVRLRDYAGQLSNDENGFRYRVDTRGFKPEEIKVDVEDDCLVVRGEHKEENNGEAVHRSFLRRVTIPKNVQKDAIKCDLDEGGRLVICAPKLAIQDSQKRSIPIEFKKNNETK